jgi:hypothetical protein
VVSFKVRQLLPQRKSPRYPLDRRLGWPEPVWTVWRSENSWLPGLELWRLGHPALGQLLYPLRYRDSKKNLHDENTFGDQVHKYGDHSDQLMQRDSRVRNPFEFFCVPVKVQALWRTDHPGPSKCSRRFTLSELILTWNGQEWLIRDSWRQQSPWSESVSELYRPSDRRLSAKLVQTSSI